MKSAPKLEKLDCSRGSPMGRPNILPQDTTAPIKLQLRKLQLVDGDYDKGGCYWGGNSSRPMYMAYDDGIQVFVRAQNRNHAKYLVHYYLPNARFFN